VNFGILLFDGADEMDVMGPARVFWALDDARPFVDAFPPTAVHLVAEHAGPVQCANGATIHATVDYATCPDLDVLVVAGGSGDGKGGRVVQHRHDPTLDFIRGQASRAQVVASVCTGAFVLAGAGLLGGRRANTHWAYRQELRDLMASRGEGFELVTERVVDDGDLVTAGGVLSGIALGFHLVERLLGPDLRAAAAMCIEAETPEDVAAPRTSAV
jgi:transcriptional regulator GlxA family with amidase domain